MDVRYEGYLLLLEAPYSRTRQTSASLLLGDAAAAQEEHSSPVSNGSTAEAWTERWCSLEGGKLLVYPDSLAAIVRPESLCCSYDLNDYQQLRTSSSYGVDSRNVWELTLVAAPAPPLSRITVLGSAKSTTFASVGNEKTLLQRQSSEANRYAFAASSSLSKATSPTILENQSGAFEDESSGREKASNERSKTWSKLTSRSRRLYKLVSGGSSNSLSDQYQSGHKRPSSSLAGLASPNSDALSSSSLASTRVSSPTTPASATYSDFDAGPVTVTFRASSAQILAKWAEAISTCLRNSRPAVEDPTQEVLRRHRSTKMCLAGSFAGYAGPVASMFPVGIPEANALMTEAAAQSRRRREESFSSLMQQGDATASTGSGHANSDLFRRRRQRSAYLLNELGDILQANEQSDPSPSSSASRSSSASSSVGQRSRSRPASSADLAGHERCSSVASAFVATVVATRASSMRRASTSVLLDFDSRTLGGATAASASTPRGEATPTHDASATASASPTQAVSGEHPERHTGNAGMKGAPKWGLETRHRRSGSLLRRGSLRRILANHASSEGSSTTQADGGRGLGLDLPDEALSRLQVSSPDSASKEKKGLAKLRSLGIRPASRAGKRASIPDFDGSNQAGDRGVLADAQQSEATRLEMASPTSPTGSKTAAPQQRSVPRAVSLLNLSKFGMSSGRERTSSRPFASPTEPGRTLFSAVPLSPVQSSRFEAEGSEFSYEVVEPSRTGRDLVDSPVARDSPKLMPSASMSAVETPDLRSIGGWAAVRLDRKKHTPSPSPKVGYRALEPLDAIAAQAPPTPPVVERILPPEEMIAAFDRLREAEDLSFSSMSRSRSAAFTKPSNSLGLAVERSDRGVPPLPAADEAVAAHLERADVLSSFFVRPGSALASPSRLAMATSSRTFVAEGGGGGDDAMQLFDRSAWQAPSPFDCLDTERKANGHFAHSLPAPPRATKRSKATLAKSTDLASHSEPADARDSLARQEMPPPDFVPNRQRFTSTAILSTMRSARFSHLDPDDEAEVGDVSIASRSSTRIGGCYWTDQRASKHAVAVRSHGRSASLEVCERARVMTAALHHASAATKATRRNSSLSLTPAEVKAWTSGNTNTSSPAMVGKDENQDRERPTPALTRKAGGEVEDEAKRERLFGVVLQHN
ncbi:hypothetical protein ACQY0O_007574 [Thecaphora frezii]